MVAVREWAALQVPDTHLLGLVLVDDAPRVARPLAAVMNRVLHSAPHGWHLLSHGVTPAGRPPCGIAGRAGRRRRADVLRKLGEAPE
jgi:hypothetical protein